MDVGEKKNRKEEHPNSFSSVVIVLFVAHVLRIAVCLRVRYFLFDSLFA